MGLWVLTGWLISPLFIVASLLTPYAVTRLANLSSRTFIVSKRLILLMIIITLAIPFALQFPAWWAMGGWPPPRTVDAIYFVFIVSWFFMLGLVSIFFLPQINSFTNRQQSSLYINLSLSLAAICFVLAVLGSFRFQRVYTDLTLRAEPFHEYMLKRYELIYKSVEDNNLALRVPAFNEEYPRSIYFNDIVPDYRDWRNVCYADLFGLQYIKREAQQIESYHKVKRLRTPFNGYN